jgi:hypothetical protein
MHPVLAQKYRKMAHVYLIKNEYKKDEVYNSLIECAEEHERKVRILGRKRGRTFIFMRGAR